MTTKGENHCIAMHFITIYIPAGLGIGCMLMLIITDEHSAQMLPDVGMVTYPECL